ncbi:MAG: zf-HC2 domain-containing protein [Gaiellaceae bacterium]
MSTRSGCEEVRALAPELALGIADGKERADALAHLASCAACRAYLAELTDVADDLLALTPSEEPPAGFETRVLAELGIAEPAPRSRWLPRFGTRPRLVLASAATALVAMAATATGLVLAFDDERELAGQYQAALDRVDGEYFQAARLQDAAGTPVGQVFGYQGRPSWLFLVVYEPFREASLTGSVVTTRGETIALGDLDVGAEEASWGGELPVDLREVAVVRLTSASGTVFEARIPGGPGE